jgi:predicted lipoprotein with Yx(FWY)xxD motif
VRIIGIINVRHVVAGAAVVAIAGCGGATTPAGSSAGGVSAATPTPTSTAATPTPASSATVVSAMVSGHGAVLVAGFNSMTLYQFDMDRPGSATSACTGGCSSTWPPLTVPPGTSPTAASGITGKWGIITRTDGKGIQVTVNGHPLYFYSGDTKPGDANGNYPHWSSVSAASGGAAPAPSATPARSGSTPSNPYGY